eukprot:14354042-Ditylum_brightwellii.AAC.2
MQALLIKLQTAHSKANFEIFNKTYKRMELETFPKKTEDVKRSLRDTVVKIGYLTGVNQDAVHYLGYQDKINNLMDSVLDNIEGNYQTEYLKEYVTNAEDAVYDVQLCAGYLNVSVHGQQVNTNAMAVCAKKSHAKL